VTGPRRGQPPDPVTGPRRGQPPDPATGPRRGQPPDAATGPRRGQPPDVWSRSMPHAASSAIEDPGPGGEGPRGAGAGGGRRGDAGLSGAGVAVGVLAAVGLGLVALPLAGLLVRAPWRGLGHQIGRPEARQALALSLECSLGALAVCLAVGVPLAWVLARSRLPGRSVVRAVVLLPMVMPPVVGGVALLFAFGRGGVVPLPVTLPFTTAGAVVAEAFVALPFLVLATEAGLRQLDPRLEEAAAALGAGPWARFRHVTLPLLGPSLAAGAAGCWARALGEFGATITFAGSLPGRTRTLPLAVYTALQTDRDAALALSVVLLGVSVVVIAALRGRWTGR
jgi:molybdate transport system permease protein